MSDFPSVGAGLGPTLIFPDRMRPYSGLFAMALSTCYFDNNTTDSAMNTSNTAVFMPIFLPRRFVCRRMGFFRNGGNISGHWDLGLYDVAGTRLSSTGSILHSGANTPQSASLTADVTLQPNIPYYVAAVFDNTTATVRSYFVGGIPLGEWGLMTMATAFALPSTATFTKAAGLDRRIPRLVLSERTVL